MDKNIFLYCIVGIIGGVSLGIPIGMRSQLEKSLGMIPKKIYVLEYDINQNPIMNSDLRLKMVQTLEKAGIAVEKGNNPQEKSTLE